ncbi:hypothetical protein SAMN05216251_12371 [Actinacidiphila alni]|uniref:NAD-dependent epimerase/dehydratase family protein n=1 Tax=Actinacidiphila alni TaxID=380248 RepID=A0A1I2KLK9_9ACTN|nr:hypothetical protein SAMN05216251_12371 [Actinacidiphila alni]
MSEFGGCLSPGRPPAAHRTPDTRPDERHVMKVAVIGGTGLIGSQLVSRLNAAGHEAVPHALSTGVDVISGKGVPEAVAGADVVVNLTNSPTFDEASPDFFRTSPRPATATGSPRAADPRKPPPCRPGAAPGADSPCG